MLVHFTATPRRPDQVRSSDFLIEHSNVLGLVSIIAIFWIAFTYISPGFISSFNLFTLLRNLGIDVVIGFSTMVVLATGGMNLAIGSIGVCSVMFSGYLMQTLNVSPALALSAGVFLGAALGFANGLAIVRTGVSAFIVTLGTASLYMGAMLILTKAAVYDQLPVVISEFGRIRWGFISPLLLISLAVGASLIVLFRFSSLGREILATGANSRAAELSGIRIGNVIVFAHSLSGALASLAGLMLLCRLGSAAPSIGQDWLLPSFLAPVLGGTLLAGGYVSVVGTLLGGLLVATIRSGLLVLQIGNFWLQLFLGVILLLAVLLERYRSIYTERRRVGGQ
jgi:ribose transport system permease protein